MRGKEFQDEDVDLSQLTYQETTVAIFMLERLSYGVDSLMRSVLSWDVSVKALANQQETVLQGSEGTLRTSRSPSNAEVMYSFIVLRSQFIRKYYESLWHTWETPKPKGQQTGEGEERLGVWSFLKAMTGKQRSEFLTQQLTSLLFSLVSTLALLVSFILLLVISLILLGIAGLAKFAAIFLMGIFMFMLPFAYFIKGRKAVLAGFNLTVVYLFLKGAVVLVIWIGFFMLEGVVLQGYREVAVDHPELVMLVEAYQPGFLYTDAGSDLLFVAEQGWKYQMGIATIGKTLLSMIVLMLTMIYIVLKLPGFLAAMLGVQSLSDDVFSSFLFIAGGAASLGKMAVGAVAKGASSANTIKPAGS